MTWWSFLQGWAGAPDVPPPFIIGVDEVGVGCIAGPVTVGAVCAPSDWEHKDLRDSKKLSEKKLHFLTTMIAGAGVGYAVRSSSVQTINRVGIREALTLAYNEAVDAVLADLRAAHGNDVDYLIVIDGLYRISGPHFTKCLAKPKADGYVPTVMAASIIAKTTRDTAMEDLHVVYPQYGFQNHVGYGTEEHLTALKKYGACDIHRTGYGPVKRAAMLHQMANYGRR